jgi:predicted MPP superfamily phosphohydrolase
MTSQPLFWIYLLVQFNIFIYLTNRVGFRPRFRANETTWTLVWTAITVAVQVIPGVLLAEQWDFTWAGWSTVPFGWQCFVLATVLSVVLYWLEFFHWYFFRKKPVQFKVLSRMDLPISPRFGAPFAFLKYVGFENQIYQPEVVEYEVKLPHWPKEFSGLSIVQLSDIHYGKYMNLDYLQILVEAAKKLKPDIFALTGDFISFRKHAPAMKGLFKGLKAPLGVYALLGNHDYWSDPEGLRKILERDGVRVLRNEVVVLKRKKKTLATMGVDDLWEGQKNEKPILQAKADAKILLAHHPDHFYLAKKTKSHLQISGHCHGGQICFPFWGPLIIPSTKGRKYVSGFVREGNTTLFANRGIGGYPPLRTYCKPEMVKLILLSDS